MAETTREKLDRRLAQLKNDRSGYEHDWRDLSDNFLPRRGRFLGTNDSRGHWSNKGPTKSRRNTKIVDGTPRYAARTLAAGMMAGYTSPSRPWFRFATPDPELMKFRAVRDWLRQVEEIIRDILARSNFYNQLAAFYIEQGVFGTSPIAIEDDRKDVIRAFQHTIGSYYIANNSRGMVDVFFREFSMSVEQLYQKFGKPTDIISTQAGLHKSSGKLDQPIQIVHALMPNESFADGLMDNNHMPYRSVYYESAANENTHVLRQSGFKEFPIMTARWDLTGDEVYGGGPGLDALGDARALQIQHRRKAKAIDKHVDPPMRAAPSLRNDKTSLLPGDVTYVEGAAGAAGFEPAYNIKPNIPPLIADIQDLRQLINHAMYRDMFLMLADSDRREITAREVEEKHGEKLLMLGPILERQNTEVLDPALDRIFAIAQRRGRLPDPPKELDGVDLKVEYTSLLAQAQKQVSLSGIERTVGFVAESMNINPEIADKVDLDTAVDEYAEAVGVPPNMIRDKAGVKALRTQRQKAEQDAQVDDALAQVPDAAQKLAKAPIGKGTALDEVVAA